ncbi:MAG: SPOR domain-containing protein [bacterium]
MNVRTTLLACTLALAACSRGDRKDTPAKPTTATLPAMRGPDHLVLRVPRAGGEARVYAYPRLDTVVWSVASAPGPDHVLAFDEEAGSIAYVDAKGLPARLDFRQGLAERTSKAKLTGPASSDGSNVFGIAPDGAVERTGPSGLWRWKPPRTARAVFPQPDATLLVLGEQTDGSVVWRLRPPAMKIVDSVPLTKVERSLRTQVGDRLYLGSGSELTGVRTRTMQRTTAISFSDVVELLEATPSGDRVFVVTRTGTSVEVVDRYREAISGHIDVGRHVAVLRVDPLGRYLLARPEGTDSALVIALGTNRVIGAVSTNWRDDLPFVAPDGGIALAQGSDVVIVDGETLRPVTRVKGGAADFWYAFRWTGFRPRDSRLDKPVDFGGGTKDSAAAKDSTAPGAAKPDSFPAPVPTAPAATPPSVPRDTATRKAAGYTVSFAALLVADRARELAGRIKVGNESARVVTAQRDGSTIYRVVLGPYATREEAERIGRESKQTYWVYEGGP